MTFPGFTPPTNPVLPPEFEQILPKIDTMAELKIVLVALILASKPGRRGPLAPSRTLATLTGLSRQAVLDGLHLATAHGYLVARKAGTRTIYEPAPRELSTGYPQATPPLAYSVGQSGENHVQFRPPDDDSLHSAQHQHQQQEVAGVDQDLLRDLLHLGLSQGTADALLHEFDADYLRRHLAATTTRLGSGRLRNPAGYLLCSLRDNWPTAKPKPETWYTPTDIAEGRIMR